MKDASCSKPVRLDATDATLAEAVEAFDESAIAEDETDSE